MPKTCSRYLECFILLDRGWIVQNFSKFIRERDANCVIYLTTLQDSCDTIVMTFGGVFVEDTFFSSMSPMQGIHGLLTIQSPGLSLVSQQHIVLVSSSGGC